MSNDYNSQEPLLVDDTAKSYLAEAAKWGYFLAIVGFVVVALIVLAVLLLIVVGGTFLAALSNDMGGLPVTFLSIFYLLLGGLYLYPTMKLYNFSKAAKAAVASNDTSLMTESMRNLKSMFKFVGIFTAIVLGIYALIFLFAILAGVLGR